VPFYFHSVIEWKRSCPATKDSPDERKVPDMESTEQRTFWCSAAFLPMPWLSFVFVSERGATVFCPRIRGVQSVGGANAARGTHKTNRKKKKSSKSTTDSLECAPVRVCECRVSVCVDRSCAVWGRLILLAPRDASWKSQAKHRNTINEKLNIN